MAMLVALLMPDTQHTLPAGLGSSLTGWEGDGYWQDRLGTTLGTGGASRAGQAGRPSLASLTWLGPGSLASKVGAPAEPLCSSWVIM